MIQKKQDTGYKTHLREGLEQDPRMAGLMGVIKKSPRTIKAGAVYGAISLGISALAVTALAVLTPFGLAGGFAITTFDAALSMIGLGGLIGGGGAAVMSGGAAYAHAAKDASNANRLMEAENEEDLQAAEKDGEVVHLPLHAHAIDKVAETGHEQRTGGPATKIVTSGLRVAKNTLDETLEDLREGVFR